MRVFGSGAALLCLLPLLLSSTASAERWVTIDAAAPEMKLVQMDYDSAEVRAGFRAAIIKTEYRATRKSASGQLYDLLVQRLVQDCEGRRHALISMTVFNEGKYMSSLSNSETEWLSRMRPDNARPGSPDARLKDYICKAPVAIPEDPGKGAFNMQIVSQLAEAPLPLMEQWQPIENGNPYNKAYLDLGSVFVVGDYRTIIHKIVYNMVIKPVNEEPYDSVMMKWAIDCEARRYAIISATFLMGTKLVRSGSESDGTWARNVRESPVGDVATARTVEALCAAPGRANK